MGALGVVLIAVAVGLTSFGLAEDFRETMSSLFLYAAFTHEPRKSGGLDQALHDVLQRPFGPPLLVLMAAGLASYGVFCFRWARHLDR